MEVLHAPWFTGNPYQHLLSAALAREGVDVVAISRSHMPGLWMQQKQRPLHLHWLHPFTGRLQRSWFERHLRRAAPQGLFWTVHNLMPHDVGGSDMALRRWLLDNAHACFAHGPATCRAVQDHFDLDAPPISIPHGPYPGPVFATPCPDGPLVSFGRIRAYKQLLDLVDVAQAFPDRPVIVAGPADDPRAVARLAAAGIDVRPTFHSDEELDALLSQAAAVVIPGMGLTSGVLVRALSRGLPVVVPDGPGAEDMLPTGAGRAFAPGGLVEAVGQVLAEDQGRMRAAAATYPSTHRWADAAERIAAAYRA